LRVVINFCYNRQIFGIASRIGTDTKRDLLLAYPETDESLDKLSSWPVSPTNNKREFQTRERYINHRVKDLEKSTAVMAVNIANGNITTTIIFAICFLCPTIVIGLPTNNCIHHLLFTFRVMLIL
jgi:hypothetical protein